MWPLRDTCLRWRADNNAGKWDLKISSLTTHQLSSTAAKSGPQNRHVVEQIFEPGNLDIVVKGGKDC